MPICRISGKEFEISEQERLAYGRFGMSVPDLHPSERQRFFYTFSNSRTLFFVNDARTGKRVMTNYDPEQFPVIYSRDNWMSGDFDGRDFGRDVDFSRPFFEQWHELMKAVPQPSLTMLHCEDCDFCNHSIGCKRCYLAFNALESDNIYYSNFAFYSKDSIELFACRQCELCFQCLHCQQCFNVKFSTFAERCQDSAFLYDCEDCSYCYQCVNLKHQRYCIQNVQHTPEEYEKKMAEIDLGSYEVLAQEQRKWQEFLSDKPLRGEHLTNCENSTGVLLTNCRNCHNCYQIVEGDNNVNTIGQQITDSCDSGGWLGASGLVWTSGVVNSRDSFCSETMENCFNMGYCMMTFHSNDCFGCYGLRKTQYCILNKQYTKKEYEALRDKLVEHMKKTGEWGQWFPHKFSPFYVEDTTMLQKMPVSDEQAAAFGLRRRPKQAAVPVQNAAVLPDHVKEMTVSDMQKVFKAVTSGKRYKIVPQELAVHRRLNIALPREDWVTRLNVFVRDFDPVPHDAICANCHKAMFSWLEPSETARPIWCDACYLQAFRA